MNSDLIEQSLSEAPRKAVRSAWMQDLDTVRVLWRRDLLRFLRQPSRIVGALGQPIIFWLVIGAGMTSTFRLPGASNVNYLEYFFPGVVQMVVVFASIFSTLSVIEDRHQGFLQAVLVSPGSRAAMVLGKSLGSTTVALMQVALFIGLAPFAGFSLASVSWAPLLGSLILTSLGLTCFGFAVAWLLDNVQAYHAIQMTLLVPLWVISGAMFPAPTTGVFGVLMHLNPLAFAVDATRRSLYGGALPPGVPSASSLAFDGAVLLLAALAAFGVAVAAASRKR
jgi:daunorubicin resistance ABC transporter membrane protein